MDPFYSYLHLLGCYIIDKQSLLFLFTFYVLFLTGPVLSSGNIIVVY